jgi:hypothetical protein
MRSHHPVLNATRKVATLDWNTLMTERFEPQSTRLLVAANDNPGGSTRATVALASLVNLLARSCAGTMSGGADTA